MPTATARKKFRGYRVVVVGEVFCRFSHRMSLDAVIEAELQVLFEYEAAGHDAATVAHPAIRQNGRTVAEFAPNPDWSWDVTRYDSPSGVPITTRYRQSDG